MASLRGYDNFSGQLSEQLVEVGDERIPLEAPLSASWDLPDNKIQTSAVVIFRILLMIGLLAATFAVPHFTDLPVPVFSLIVYMHCGVWALLFILDAYLRKQHTLLASYGFIEFYQKTKTLRRTSLNIMSSGTILMLITNVVIKDHCRESLECPAGWSTFVYLQVIIVLETMIILPVHIYYLSFAELNREFHQNRAQPDIEPQDFITSILQSHSSNEIGYRDNGPLEDIVEKQSDMIRYLKLYNTFLQKKVLRLSEELENSRNRNLVNV